MEEMKPKVMVLMSSYNGEKYIDAQIQSILQQKGVDVSILLRDDGSKDRTKQIINRIKSDSIRLIVGENIGATESFFELIKLSDHCDYYAFSDQDDVWDDDKLKIAIDSIKELKGPVIYSSNTRLVDENLKYINDEDKHPNTTLASAMMKDYATGCTIVFNSELMEVLKCTIPSYAANHDWWVNLVALSIGGVSVFDRNPHMSYRQHGNNVVGAPTSFLRKWKSRLFKFRNISYQRDVMAQELLDLLGENITNENRKVLYLFSNYRRNKIRILINPNFKSGCKVDDFLFIITVILNKI